MKEIKEFLKALEFTTDEIDYAIVNFSNVYDMKSIDFNEFEELSLKQAVEKLRDCYKMPNDKIAQALLFISYFIVKNNWLRELKSINSIATASSQSNLNNILDGNEEVYYYLEQYRNAINNSWREALIRTGRIKEIREMEKKIRERVK